MNVALNWLTDYVDLSEPVSRLAELLKQIGLPVEGIALILVVDWLLDRFRTTVNVWGDCVGAAFVDARM